MVRRLVDWEKLGDWFDAKQGDEGDLWHRALINPTVLRVIGPASGLRVLDMACGNGALSRQLARMGAQVVGVDLSTTLIARARERESRDPIGIAYHIADAAHLGMFSSDQFDLVVCNMGLLDMPDSTVEQALKEVSRVLRYPGRLVASIQHPCFEGTETAAWVIEKLGLTTTVWRKVCRYRDRYEIINNWRLAPGPYLQTISYHRPLSWYFRSLWAAELAVTGFEENEPTEEFVQEDIEGLWIKQIPLHCVIEARKLA